MKKVAKQSYPYHYSVDKNFLQVLIDWGVPILLFWLYFQYYNFGKITSSEMIKTSGLLAIGLLSLTLIIGPITRIFPKLDFLKAHRKTWGILSFLIALTHTVLIINFYFKLDLIKFTDTANPKFLGLMAGLAAVVILALVTLTSTKTMINSLSPKTWKIIQTTSYLALLLAIVHFYLVESTNGVLVIKRLLGQITFGFAAAVILLRLITQFLPNQKN